MKKSTLLSLLVFAQTISASCQPFPETGNLFLQLKQISETGWGVFVIPDQTIQPTGLTRMGSGQVTLVVPAGFTYYSFENHSGTWVENAKVTSPVEAKDRAYISFGFVMDSPKVCVSANEALLLFTFETDEWFTGTFSLFENGKDPFETPNSYGTNPGNDIGMIDRENGQVKYYTYRKNIPTTENGTFYSNENSENGGAKARALLVSKSDEESITIPKE